MDNAKADRDQAEDKKEVDIYRDTPVRLLGYANEVGESFRALTSPWFVRATYGVSGLYVVADTTDKATKMARVPLARRKWATTLVGLATIPFIVHPIDALVHYGMDKTVRPYLHRHDGP
ncbi:mitochondrial fission process protein 1 [Hyalella azteca]|uniref:Mitochondrial fission process protein 1 n=1 Tax=Hyalella azteca TaxID=294128 RepID=A0A8B7NJ56_HYAAZ|nr:mitochondrial fission process protein 1 [Hyalella azteca]